MNKKDELVKTKFNIPYMGNSAVRRIYLNNKLDLFKEYRIISVFAPAGYGKTALVSSWLSNKDLIGTNVSWLSLDDDDNDEENFWSYFICSFYRTLYKNKMIKTDIYNKYIENTSFNRLHIVKLINTAESIKDSVLIVVDDFHRISNAKVIENIKFLIKNMPENMHLILIGRQNLYLEQAKLMISGMILEIKSEELKFRDDEMNCLLNNIIKREVRSEEAKIIMQKTDGWAAGIQMAALSMLDDSRSIEKLEYKDNNLMFDYLAEEVYCKLDEEIRNFLKYTSILDEFSEGLCDYLFDCTDSGRKIQYLVTQGLFINCLDNEHKWYRYNSIFKNFLVDRVVFYNEHEKENIVVKIAEWYSMSNDIPRAVKYYIKAKDYSRAVRYIKKISSITLLCGQAKRLDKWNKLLPQNIVNKDKRLLMNSAWAAAEEAKSDEVKEYLSLAEKLESNDKTFDIEKIALCTTSITSYDNLYSMIEECLSALSNLNSKDFLYQLITFNLANIYLLQGKMKDAAVCFESLIAYGSFTGFGYILCISGKALADWYRVQGRYEEAEKICYEIIERTVGEHDMLLPSVGLIYAELGDIYYEWNDTKKVIEAAAKGLNISVAGEDNWATIENYFVLIKLYSSINLERERNEYIIKIERIIRSSGLNDIRIRYISMKAKNALDEGKFAEAHVMINQVKSLVRNDMMMLYPDYFLAEAELYIYEGNYEKASLLIDKLRHKAEKIAGYRVIIRLMLLEILISEKKGKINNAIALTKEAMAIAEKYSMKRTFLYCADKLKSLGKEKCALSIREIEILKMMSYGASNSEIADRLFISINTVKTHISSIYLSLDAHNRVKAIEKARELKLI